MNTLADRIKTERKANKLTQERLGELVGVGKSSVSQWESGLTKQLVGENLLRTAKALKVSPDWLSTGKGDKYGINHFDSAAVREELPSNYVLGGFDTWDSNTPLREDEVELPFFREVELAAGPGRHEIIENHGAKLRFAKSTLKRKGVQEDHAACVTVSGNSMEPVLPNGSTVGIDTLKTSIVNGKMYAIDHNGELRVKLAYTMPGGGVRLRSYNIDEYPDEPYQDASCLRILGQVFWYSVLL